jgi:hypothetical protein
MLPEVFREVDDSIYTDSFTWKLEVLRNGVYVPAGEGEKYISIVEQEYQEIFRPWLKVRFSKKSGHDIGDYWQFVINEEEFSPQNITFTGTGSNDIQIVFDESLLYSTTWIAEETRMTISITQNGHLRGFSHLIGWTLDQSFDKIERIGTLSHFHPGESEGYVSALTEMFDFPKLKAILRDEDLITIVPWLVRLYKMRGMEEAIWLLARKMFGDKVTVEVSDYDYATDSINVLGWVKEGQQLSEDELEYINKKLEYMTPILERFVPVYTLINTVSIADKLILTEEKYSRHINDDILDFQIVFDFTENIAKPSDELTLGTYILEHYVNTVDDVNIFDVNVDDVNSDAVLLPLEKIRSDAGLTASNYDTGEVLYDGE